jgi:hypothetical protein
MTTPRTAFKITTINRGSEVAAETAAAFASASVVFRHYDSFYADVLLLHAKQVMWISPPDYHTNFNSLLILQENNG